MNVYHIFLALSECGR